MTDLKTYLTRMIEHVEHRSRLETSKNIHKDIPPKSMVMELHYLDGMYEALTTVLKHIEELEHGKADSK